MTKYSDYYIREKIVKGVAKNLCFLHPNIVTLLNAVVGVYIVKNLIHKKSNMTMLCLVILNRYLDLLDGEIARGCNKKSKLGAILDILLDILLIFVYFGFILDKTFKSRYSTFTKVTICGIIFPCCILCLYAVFLELKTNSYVDTMKNKKSFQNNLIIFYRENAFLFGIGNFMMFKLLYNTL